MAQTIQVPDELYERLRRTAEAMRAPLDAVAGRALAAGLPLSAADAPEGLREALRGLEELPDDDLWSVWRMVLEPAAVARHGVLLDKNAAGTLSSEEREELDRLREEADRVLLRRAHAAALLRWRGHALPTMD